MDYNTSFLYKFILSYPPIFCQIYSILTKSELLAAQRLLGFCNFYVKLSLPLRTMKFRQAKCHCLRKSKSLLAQGLF